jgi:hypothetical protein
MSNLPIGGVTDALATAGDVLFEIPAGFTFPGYAAIATTYMHRYGASAEPCCASASESRQRQAQPQAQFQARIADLMAGRIAKAEQKGCPCPPGRPRWFMRRRSQSVYRLAVAPVRLLPPSPTAGQPSFWWASWPSATDDPLYVIGSSRPATPPRYGRAELTGLRRPTGRPTSYEMAE